MDIHMCTHMCVYQDTCIEARGQLYEAGSILESIFFSHLSAGPRDRTQVSGFAQQAPLSPLTDPNYLFFLFNLIQLSYLLWIICFQTTCLRWQGIKNGGLILMLTKKAESSG